MKKLKKCQTGGPISDNTYVAPKRIPLTKEEERQQLIKRSEQSQRDANYANAVVSNRQRNINTKNRGADRRFNIQDKFRLAPNSVGGIGEMFDEYLNPAYMVGQLASNVGNSRSLGEFGTNLALTAGLGVMGFDPLSQSLGLAKGAAQKIGSGIKSVVPQNTAAGRIVEQVERAGQMMAADVKDLGTVLAFPDQVYKNSRALRKAEKAFKTQYDSPEALRRLDDYNMTHAIDNLKPKVSLAGSTKVGNNQGIYYGSPDPSVKGPAYVNVDPWAVDDAYSTGVHELTHQLTNGDKGLSNYMKMDLGSMFKNTRNDLLKMSPDNFSNNIEYQKYIDHVDYYTRPTEVHARINEIRHHLNPTNPWKSIELEDKIKLNNSYSEGKLPSNVKNMMDLLDDVGHPDLNTNKMLKIDKLADIMNRVPAAAPIAVGAGIGGVALNQKQLGGPISTTGYLPDSPDRFNKYNIIPSNIITMDTVPHDVLAIPDKGKPKLMKKNSGLHKFTGATSVTEFPMMQVGGSIVDTLESKNQNSSFSSRAALAKQMGIQNYKGTAEQNMLMLKMLDNPTPVKAQAPAKVPVKAAPVKMESGKAPVKPAQLRGYNKPIMNLSDYNTYAQGFDNRNLESGVITDKRTNTNHIIQQGKVVKSFPILTGSNPNRNDNMGEMLENGADPRATPVGAYMLKPNANLYGEPGFNMNAIPAFGENAPRAENLAQHVTYHPEERAKYYKMSPEQRYRSYGCVNCQKPDINDMTTRFPQGDTALVIDSKNKRDQAFLNKFTPSKELGGAFRVPKAQAGAQFFNPTSIPDSYAWSNPVIPGQTPPKPFTTQLYRTDQTPGTPVAQDSVIPIDRAGNPLNKKWNPSGVEMAGYATGAMGLIGDELNRIPNSKILNKQINRGTTDSQFQTYTPTNKRGFIDMNSGSVAPDQQTYTQFANRMSPEYYGQLPIAQMGLSTGLSPELVAGALPTFSMPDMMSAPAEQYIEQPMVEAPDDASAYDELKKFVKKQEGFADTARWDYKQFTNGYGTKASANGEKITRAEAEARLDRELLPTYKKVQSSVKAPLKSGQLAALSSIAYNAGFGNVKKLINQINKGADPAEIADMIKATATTVNNGAQVLPGLVSRRKKEANLFTRSYKEGGTYDLSPDEIQDLVRQGYQVEYQ